MVDATTTKPTERTWRDALDTAKHRLGVLDSILFLIGQSSDSSTTADGYVETKRIGGRFEETLAEPLGQDALAFARRVAWEGWGDIHDACRETKGDGGEVEGALYRIEKLLAVAAVALRVVPFEDPDTLPCNVTFGLYRLVHDELDRVNALVYARSGPGRGKQGPTVDAVSSPYASTTPEGDAGVPLPEDCTHSFICQGCGLLGSYPDARHLLALMEAATKAAERLHARLPAEQAETFRIFVLGDLGDATAGFREIVEERFDQPAEDLEALVASLRDGGAAAEGADDAS